MCVCVCVQVFHGCKCAIREYVLLMTNEICHRSVKVLSLVLSLVQPLVPSLAPLKVPTMVQHLVLPLVMSLVLSLVLPLVLPLILPWFYHGSVCCCAIRPHLTKPSFHHLKDFAK